MDAVRWVLIRGDGRLVTFLLAGPYVLEIQHDVPVGSRKYAIKGRECDTPDAARDVAVGLTADWEERDFMLRREPCRRPLSADELVSVQRHAAVWSDDYLSETLRRALLGKWVPV